ncbi:GNAT family protein [Streptomyces sp. NPDC050264]|uniref:GNAT family N-acetyltransferase n=1 Tax=Streptomyces sp. NPDC050264 TaxID=3155038 RepID=UPI003429D7C7
MPAGRAFGPALGRTRPALRQTRTRASHHADPHAGWFEYGITVGAGHRGKGDAAEAVVMLLRFMIAERRCHTCQTRIFAENETSLAFHRRLGFVEEGRLRDHVFFAGRYHDLVVTGMLADEFAEQHPVSGYRSCVPDTLSV